MDSFNDDGLINEFVTEGREHLATIEPDLLILEREGQSTEQEIINRIFRAIHSIKGAAGFFGFESLKVLSHAMESLLMLIRDGKICPQPDVIEPLLMGVDKLQMMFDDIQASEHIPCEEVLSRLNQVLSGDASVNVAVTVQSHAVPNDGMPAMSFSPDKLLVESAVTHGQFLYCLEFCLQSDLMQKHRTPLDLMDQITAIGLFLDFKWELDSFTGIEECLQDSARFQVLCASVLEQDLVAQAVDVAEAQIQMLNSDDVLEVAQLPEILVVAPDNNVETISSPQPEPVVGTVETLPEAEVPASEQKVRKTNGASPESVESVRVRVDLLNKLMDLAGEMVLSRNQLLRTLGEQDLQVHGLTNIVQNIDLITSDLQEHIMQTRMQPIGSVFGRFPRVVRDMARMLNKEIDFETSGEDVELDKSIIESLSDPLTHLIRNCCDHALEAPEDRLKANKPRAGLIRLRAFHEDGQINISIYDDGAGIDHENIARKALQKGLITEEQLSRMSPQEMVNLIFLPGLSTAEKISDVSGRGVGMDVVKTNIAKLGGHIQVDTTIGKGTTFLLRLPLTLAIIPSLIVGVSDQRFAIPQINLLELVRVKASDISSKIEKVGTASVLRLRGRLLPLLRLADLLGLERAYLDSVTSEKRVDRRQEISDLRLSEDEMPMRRAVESNLVNRRRQVDSDYNIMVLKVGGNQFGLIVDELFDTEEIVVKPLSSCLKSCKCFAGATIMGDGRVAMILDAGGILNYSGLNFDEIHSEQQRQENARKQTTSNGTRQTILLFNNAKEEVFAVPLDSVLRIEKFSTKNIERIGQQEFLTYSGKGLPLLRLENVISVSPLSRELEDAYLIIPRCESGSAGIIVSNIIDALETDVLLDTTLSRKMGISGSAVVNDRLTLFIEPQGLLKTAGITA